ncbi:hypothetical protein RB595_002039 [Gaeumannomyces hyphopodioides]
MQADDPPERPDAQVDRPLGLAINGLQNAEQLPTPDSTPTDWASRSPVMPDTPVAHESAIDESPVAGSDGLDERTDLRVDTRPRTQSVTKDGVRRLSASKMRELAASPDSLPVAPIPDRGTPSLGHPLSAGIVETAARPSMADQARAVLQSSLPLEPDRHGRSHRATVSDKPSAPRPTGSPRTLSTPPMSRRKSKEQPPPPAGSRRNSFHPTPRLNGVQMPPVDGQPQPQPQPTPQLLPAETPVESAKLPLPPMSVPTFLQLELAGQRPSPLYIQHSYSSDVPYESSAVKFERLKNFLLLPSFLERTICFGALACLDAWLWTFTILPMRFVIALGVLVKWWGYVVVREARWSTGYVWYGLGRWLRRSRGRAPTRDSAGEESRSPSRARDASSAPGSAVEEQSVRFESATPRLGATKLAAPMRAPSRQQQRGRRGHRRTKSMPSNLTSFHKADILQGFVILFSCVVLMRLDASRMYHFIRAQSAIKLYVIYNGLEVGDRLLSSLGQDIFECLFSTEVLARDHLGRSKVLVPFGMFLLALVYNTCHAVTLFYQVITLNVAVNSYNNALLTLLISNQFVEIKSAVFKRFEKENVFQLTCADIVERFQLWLMLLIIAMRNIVEVGFWTIPGAISGGGPDSDDPSFARVPLHSPSVLPASFTALPAWLWSGEVLSPFLIVTGSETVVDWIKHAYINKFNNIKPNFYGRVLDILCKDYYTNAFVTPSLTRRLGLPLLPLSCLFIRASVQTYHMFLATHLPAPLPSSTQTALAEPTSATPSSPAMAASLDRLDTLIRSALGRAVHGLPYVAGGNESAPTSPSDFATSPKPLIGDWTTDDAIAALTMLTFFFLAFLVLLVLKLLLGMALLRYSRGRYARMRRRELAVAAGRLEPEVFDQKGGKRVGGFGQVEVGDERRARLYEDDPEGLKKAQATERRNVGKREKSEKDLGRISRYEMVAKRIW